MPEREEGVTELLKPYLLFISSRPGLLSLLYDVDMLPEQTVTYAGAMRLAALCSVWKAGEDGTLPNVVALHALPTPPQDREETKP